MIRPTGRSVASLPKRIKPQLTRLVEEAPTGNDWLHEVKHDGYRMHARLGLSGWMMPRLPCRPPMRQCAGGMAIIELVDVQWERVEGRGIGVVVRCDEDRPKGVAFIVGEGRFTTSKDSCEEWRFYIDNRRYE